MPQYVLLIRDDQVDYDRLGPAEFQALFQRFVGWAESLHARGKLRGVERLTPPGGGRTVRMRDGRIVIDGPYTEGKESVLGFFVVEAGDPEEAARLASDAPNLPLGGTIEVRELGAFPHPGTGSRRPSPADPHGSDPH